jgi:hypothetical protein
MYNLYQAINPLTDEARIEARARAAAIVAKSLGEMPSREQFSNTHVGKYPAWVNRLIMALCVFVLVAAFVPSAIRLYAIGSQTFAQAIGDAASATAAGVAVVIMAETAQILFSLAAAVLASSTPTSRRLLYASMAAATVLALVGNAQVSLPGHWTNPFAYLEALLPPLLVLSTAYVLKEQMLNAIEQRHSNERAFQTAYNGWQTAQSSPEQDPRYMSALANALRDALKLHNAKGSGATARKELMQDLTTDHWRALVYRELIADEWYGDSGSALPEPPPLPNRNNSEPEGEPLIEPPPPFGNYRPTLDAHVLTPMSVLAGESVSNGNGNGKHQMSRK